MIVAAFIAGYVVVALTVALGFCRRMAPKTPEERRYSDEQQMAAMSKIAGGGADRVDGLGLVVSRLRRRSLDDRNARPSPAPHARGRTGAPTPVTGYIGTRLPELMTEAERRIEEKIASGEIPLIRRNDDCPPNGIARPRVFEQPLPGWWK